MDQTTVYLHAPNPVIRAGTMTLLRERDHMVVLSERAQDRADVLVVVEESVTHDTMSMIRSAQHSTCAADGLRCVVVTDRLRPGDLVAALESGVVTVMSPNDAPSRLIGAVLSAHDGTVHLPPDLQGALVAQLQRLRQHVLEPSGLTLSGLSKREIDVLRLLSEGRTTQEIALELNYSQRTVKNVLYGLMTRLGLSNRAHAVAYAVRAGAI
jgi:DNA-binding NarL/FixJ family response regulator